MAYVVMAYIAMAYIAMAYIVLTYIVMARTLSRDQSVTPSSKRSTAPFLCAVVGHTNILGNTSVNN